MQPIRSAVFGLLIAALALPVAAQTLSSSEQAALTQRGATEAERAALLDGCRIDGLSTPTGSRLDLGSGIVGSVHRVVSVDALRILRVMNPTRQPDANQMVRDQDLPNGGLAGFDFCGSFPLQTVLLRHDPGPDGVILWYGLRLRQGLDWRRDYPNTGAEILRRGQIIRALEGLYLVIDRPEELGVVSWLFGDGRNHPAVDRTRVAVTMGGLAYIPVGANALPD